MLGFKRMFFVIVTIMLLVTVHQCVFAEGSREMAKNGGKRPFTEWNPSQNFAGIPKITQLSVYVNEGETICFGSNSYARSADVVVTDPSGTQTNYDVLANGTGLIDTFAKEQAGPLPNTGGYTPLTIEVYQTGIWKFQFNGHKIVNSTGADYRAVTAQGATGPEVTAWDITVRDSNNREIKGRTFTHYIAVQMHTYDGGACNSIFYVLTKDGYKYKVDMNGMGPGGYIFYSNNRGFIDKTNNSTLYHAADAGTDNTLSTFNGNVKALLPSLTDTDTDITHRIFFNEPSSDLPPSMPTTPVSPAYANNFRFSGSQGTQSKLGEGGLFSFDATAATTYNIFVDINKNWVYDADVDVKLSGVSVKGSNSIYWNGKDISGKAIEGTFNARLTMNGGECHFPFLDVENNPNGVKIQLLNPPFVPSGYNVNNVWYDFSNYTAANGVSVSLNPTGSKIAPNPRTALQGVDSSDGAMAYSAMYGDYRGVDVWTYFPGTKSSTTFTILPADENRSGVISGYVFFDKDKDKIFDAGESGLSGIALSVTSGDKVISATTDGTGHYTAIVPYGGYTVTVNSPSGYVLTTGNSTQTGNLAAPTINVADIGYYLSTDVGITLTKSDEVLKGGQKVIYTLTIKNNGSINATNVVVQDSLPAYLKYISDDSNGLYSYQTGKLNIGTVVAGATKTVKITAKMLKVTTYNNTATVSISELDSNSANNSAVVSFTAVNSTAPVATDMDVVTTLNTAVTGVVNATDVENDTLIFTKNTDPSNGSVVVNQNGSWTYTPNNNFSGVDSFKVFIDDSYGGTAICTVKITVTPIDIDAVDVKLIGITNNQDGTFTVNFKYLQSMSLLKQQIFAKYPDGSVEILKEVTPTSNGYANDSVTISKPVDYIKLYVVSKKATTIMESTITTTSDPRFTLVDSERVGIPNYVNVIYQQTGKNATGVSGITIQKEAGLQSAITAYRTSLTNNISNEIAGYEAISIDAGKSLEDIQAAIDSANGDHVVLEFNGSLNLNNMPNGYTFGSSTKAVTLICGHLNVNNSPGQFKLYGNLIVKGNMNANSNFNLTTYKVGNKYGNYYVMTGMNHNNGGVYNIAGNMYSGSFMFNSVSNVVADKLIVGGDFNFNQPIQITVNDMVAGRLTLNQGANITCLKGDLAIVDYFNKNSTLNVTVSGRVVVGGNITFNGATPAIYAGRGSSALILQGESVATTTTISDILSNEIKCVLRLNISRVDLVNNSDGTRNLTINYQQYKVFDRQELWISYPNGTPTKLRDIPNTMDGYGDVGQVVTPVDEYATLYIVGVYPVAITDGGNVTVKSNEADVIFKTDALKLAEVQSVASSAFYFAGDYAYITTTIDVPMDISGANLSYKLGVGEGFSIFEPFNNVWAMPVSADGEANSNVLEQVVTSIGDDGTLKVDVSGDGLDIAKGDKRTYVLKVKVKKDFAGDTGEALLTVNNEVTLSYKCIDNLNREIDVKVYANKTIKVATKSGLRLN